jgi:hypothetical protein
MADSEATTIPAFLLPDEALAFAAFIQKLTLHAVSSLSDPGEGDVTWQAIQRFQRHLAEPDLPMTMTLTGEDIRSLADRFHRRGTSRMFIGSPAMQADFKRAAVIIRSLLDQIEEGSRFLADVEIMLES